MPREPGKHGVILEPKLEPSQKHNPVRHRLSRQVIAKRFQSNLRAPSFPLKANTDVNRSAGRIIEDHLIAKGIQTMPNSGSTKLTIEEQKQFERDGYLFPIKVLDEPGLRKYLERFMDYYSRNRSRLDALPSREKYRVFSETHFVLPWVYEIVSSPEVLDAVESLLGPNLLAWNTNWFAKMPGEKTYVSMHQDGTYWNLRPANVVTAWVALSTSTPANGGMRVIPGTHRVPALPQRETDVPDNALSRGQEIAVAIDEEQAVDLALQAGEMSLHHIWIVHGSSANTSLTPRIGIAIRYVTPDVVQESPGRPLAMLVRGRDDYGNFELLSPPTGNEVDLANVHTAIVDRIRAAIMAPTSQKTLAKPKA